MQHALACTDAAFVAVRAARGAAAVAVRERTRLDAEAAVALREREAAEAAAVAAPAAVEDFTNTDEFFAMLTDTSAESDLALADAASLPPPPLPAAAAAREVPEDFECPITTELMVDPVIAADGETYERAAIEEWFALGKTTAPVSNEELDTLHLFPNKKLWRRIAAWKEEGGR